jgi:hypothetical protein
MKIRVSNMVYIHCPAGMDINEASEQIVAYLEKNPRTSFTVKWSGVTHIIRYAGSPPETMKNEFLRLVSIK